MKNRIWVFDFRERMLTDIEIEDIVKEEVEKSIKEDFDKIGIEIEIINIGDAERFIKKFYERKGYSVINGNGSRDSYRFYDFNGNIGEREVIDYLKSKYKHVYNEYDFNKIIELSGKPDFLVFKGKKGKISELFFLECKKGNDGLRPNQLIWMCLSDVPVKIVYLEENNGWSNDVALCLKQNRTVKEGYRE